MTATESMFNETFSRWDIQLPREAVDTRGRGRILKAGWAIWSFRVRSPDPDEDTRLEAEFYARNQEISRMLEEKGFGPSGDEPGGVLINRFLHLQNSND